MVSVSARFNILRMRDWFAVCRSFVVGRNACEEETRACSTTTVM